MKCECSRNTTETKTRKKFSGFERDTNPRPLRYRCSALPTELSKPHESGQCGLVLYVDVMLGQST